MKKVNFIKQVLFCGIFFYLYHKHASLPQMTHNSAYNTTLSPDNSTIFLVSNVDGILTVFGNSTGAAARW